MDPTGKPATRKPAAPWVMLALIALAEFLGLTLWFSATAVIPALSRDLPLSGAQAAWLTMAVQGGFVAGTLVSALANLPDIIRARHLFALGCVAGALTTLGVATATTAGMVIACRVLTGVALACVYPPGMKIAASWFSSRRGTALGIVVGALTLGSAFPHVLAGMSTALHWRQLLEVSALLAAAGGLVVLLFVRDGPYLAVTAPFDPGSVARVFRERGTRLATLGYLGHMWELYAMWTWIGAFAAASAALRSEVEPGRFGSMAAAAALTSGAVGCIGAGVLGDRVGKARVAGMAMLTSAGCAACAGFVFGTHPAWMVALVLVWGFAVVADSAQFSALIAEYSPRDHVGTALTVQMCAGFLLTMVSIRLVPIAGDLLGAAWAFLILVPGPLLGAVAMRGLSDRAARSPTSS